MVRSFSMLLLIVRHLANFFKGSEVKEDIKFFKKIDINKN